MAKLLLGSEVTAALNERLRARVGALRAKGVMPKLAIVRCGEDPSDLAYERGALNRAGKIGVDVDVIALPADVDKGTLIETLRALNADAAVHGVLLFRPLPRHLRADEHEICNVLLPEKDVDGMTDLSAAGVYEGRKDLGFAPCTPQACLEILDHYGVDCTGKKVTVIGRSLVVGKPLAMLLVGRNATVTVCHTCTRDVPAEAHGADILVSAAGALNFVTADFVKPGQVVLDVSVNWNPDKPNGKGGVGAITGDAVFDAVEPIVDAITPVPGGVGTVTASVLVGHVVGAAERSIK